MVRDWAVLTSVGRFLTALPRCKLCAAPVEGSMRSGLHLGCSTPLQASRCTGCVSALQLSASYTPHRCKLCAVPGCVIASSPDTDMQPSSLVLCPQYLVLGASAPPGLGLDARVLSGPRCLTASIPQPFDALGGLGAPARHSFGASTPPTPRGLYASVLQHLEVFVVLCPSTLETFGAPGAQHPRCLDSALRRPRRFTSTLNPLFFLVSLCYTALTPLCFSAVDVPELHTSTEMPSFHRCLRPS
ncbi:UNVERIFIED_CONTAM: hypothetical protein FKN15_043008 [Acipenser sinensis]